MMGQGLSVASLRDRSIELITYAVSRWGERAAAATVDYFDETMAASGADIHGTMPTGIYSRDEIERIGHYQAGKLVKDNVEGFVDQIAQSAGFLVYQAGPRTMFYQGGRGVNGNDVHVEATEQYTFVNGAKPHSDYEVRYQRLPQGLETCDFCLMLASRGAVFLSKESAGGDNPDHFHRGCDCLIVAVLCHNEGGSVVADTSFEGYDTDQMYDLWQEWKGVTKKYSGKGAGSPEVRQRMAEEKLALMERRMGRRGW